MKEQCEEDKTNEKRKRKRYSNTICVDVSDSLGNGVKCLSPSPLVTVCRLPTEDHPDGRFLVAVERHSTFPLAGSQPCHTVHGLWSPEALLPANIPHSGQFHCSPKDRIQLLLICSQNFRIFSSCFHRNYPYIITIIGRIFLVPHLDYLKVLTKCIEDYLLVLW